MFCGDLKLTEIDEQMNKLISERPFVKWIPDSTKWSLVKLPTEPCAAFVANTTSIQEIFSRIHKRFRAMYSRRAFLSWFLDEGMEEEEFIEGIECDRGCSDLFS